jgi:hypothetical protein
MPPNKVKSGAANLYDQDFVAWTGETARLLRARLFDEVDIEHVAEEIEDLGKRDKRELHSRLTVLLLHLLKWTAQPEKRSSSWQSTINTQRAELDRLLEDSPSLRRTIGAAASKVYPAVLRDAMLDSGLPAATFPRDCPFTPEQVMDPNFLP